MADYAIKRLEEIPDVLGDYPGEMRMTAASDLGTEQVSFTWRRMPAADGRQGQLRAPAQDAGGDLLRRVRGRCCSSSRTRCSRSRPARVVRIAPQVVRSVWNEGPDDAVLIMCSIKSDDPEGDHETVPDFWPE